MRKTIKTLLLTFCCIVAASALLPAGAADGKVLRVHQENPPKIFCPPITAGREEHYVFELVHGRLVGIGEDGNVVPAIAESWELSPDQLTWTFHLRKDVAWHDGKPYRAEDIAFTMNIYLHKDLGKWWSGNYLPIKGGAAYNKGEADSISGVEVVDDHTIKFTTEEPNAAFPTLFTEFKTLPKHVWEKVEMTEDAHVRFALQPGGMTGTGPYKFIKYVTDQYIEFERFDDYFDGAPKIERLILRFAPIDTGMAMLQSKELDLVYEVSYDDIERLARDKNLAIEEAPNIKFIWWTRYNLWNQNPSPIKKFLQNSEFRTAITMLFDREAYVDAIMLGHATVTDTHAYAVPWTVPPDFVPTPYDPEGAKAIFARLGWDFNKDVIRILSYPSNKARDQVAGILQNDLRSIGVKAEVVVKDLAAARVDMYETFDYDLLIGGWQMGVDPSFWNIYLAGPSAGGGRGGEGYDNLEVNELFAKGARTFDFEKRQQIYWDIVRLIQKDMPKSPICFPNVVVARSTAVKNFVLAPHRGLGARFVNVHLWTLDR